MPAFSLQSIILYLNFVQYLCIVFTKNRIITLNIIKIKLQNTAYYRRFLAFTQFNKTYSDALVMTRSPVQIRLVAPTPCLIRGVFYCHFYCIKKTRPISAGAIKKFNGQSFVQRLLKEERIKKKE